MNALKRFHGWLDALPERTKIVGLIAVIALIVATPVGVFGLAAAFEGPPERPDISAESELYREAWSSGEALAFAGRPFSDCVETVIAADGFDGLESYEGSEWRRGCEDGWGYGMELADYNARQDEETSSEATTEQAPTDLGGDVESFDAAADLARELVADSAVELELGSASHMRLLESCYSAAGSGRTVNAVSWERGCRAGAEDAIAALAEAKHAGARGIECGERFDKWRSEIGPNEFFSSSSERMRLVTVLGRPSPHDERQSDCVVIVWVHQYAHGEAFEQPFGDAAFSQAREEATRYPQPRAGTDVYDSSLNADGTLRVP